MNIRKHTNPAEHSIAPVYASWKIIPLFLLLVISCTRCSTMDGPEAAAKTSFSEWGVNIRMPYRNETFETIAEDGNSATVKLTVELKVEGEWTTKQAEIPCIFNDEHWECERAIKFEDPD